MTERFVQTADGRELRTEQAGDPDGKPVVVLHGTPGAGTFYAPHVADALEKGIRLITYDRPGYGGSTAQPGRSIGDCADDIRAIAGALGIDRLAVWGMSGGGPHALACAALLPDQVVAVGSLASPAPFGADGLDYYAGMGQANVDDIKKMLDDEAGARAALPADRQAILDMTADQMAEANKSLVSDADAAAQTPEFTEYLLSGMKAGLAPGGEGWWDDSIAQLRPWGFEVESIKVPVQLWHGRQDRFVPFGHGVWLAHRIPGVDAHLTDDDGHGTLLRRRIPQVHAWLLEHF
jgi:pimeloyl-ACP methyl ester carboxylesterase